MWATNQKKSKHQGVTLNDICEKVSFMCEI